MVFPLHASAVFPGDLMRIAVLLAGLILVPASPVFAGPIVVMEFLNSDFTFGSNSPDQEGYDLGSLSVDSLGFPVGLHDGSYAASGAAFVSQALDFANGDVVGSRYFYTGGVFEIFLSIDKNGQQVTGSFAAPVKKLAVTAGEAEDASATAWYELGAGLFDAAIADALGIGRHTTGGQAFSRLILTSHGNRSGEAGDHTTPVRQAWDGVNHVTLDVPEPAMLALFTTGAALAIRRRPRR